MSEQAVRDAAKLDALIELVHQTSMRGAKLIGAPPQDVPRFCIAAAHRLVERLVEQYREISAVAPTDLTGLDLMEFKDRQAQRRAQILAALQDMEEALSEGQRAVADLAESLLPADAKVTLQ